MTWIPGKQIQRKPALEAELAAHQEKGGSLQAELAQIESKGLDLKDRMGKLDQIEEAVCPLCGQAPVRATTAALSRRLSPSLMPQGTLQQ